MQIFPNEPLERGALYQQHLSDENRRKNNRTNAHRTVPHLLLTSSDRCGIPSFLIRRIPFYPIRVRSADCGCDENKNRLLCAFSAHRSRWGPREHDGEHKANAECTQTMWHNDCARKMRFFFSFFTHHLVVCRTFLDSTKIKKSNFFSLRFSCNV